MKKYQLLANQIKTDFVQLDIDIETGLYKKNLLALVAEATRINKKMIEFMKLVSERVEEMEAKGILHTENTEEDLNQQKIDDYNSGISGVSK